MNNLLRTLQEVARAIRVGSKNTARTIRTTCLIMSFSASIIGVTADILWVMKIMA
jgi:hypothetical protein